jgi:hypothetical protein
MRTPGDMRSPTVYRNVLAPPVSAQHQANALPQRVVWGGQDYVGLAGRALAFQATREAERSPKRKANLPWQGEGQEQTHGRQ